MFNHSDELLAVCVETSIVIFDVQRNITLMQLDGHLSPVKSILFSRHLKDCLISVSDDRTFKIWNTSSKQIVYNSSVISASPFTFICEDPVLPRLVIASADGKLRYFDSLDNFRCLSTVDISFIMKKRKEKAHVLQQKQREQFEFKIVSSEPIWKQQTDYLERIFSSNDNGSSSSSSNNGDSAYSGNNEVEFHDTILYVRFVALKTGKSYVVNMHNTKNYFILLTICC